MRRNDPSAVCSAVQFVPHCSTIGELIAKYIIHFEANAEAWPTDPAAVLAIWEGVVPAATALLDAGTLSTIDWTSNTEGYATLEASSKAVVLEVTAAFFPLFNQSIEEVVPWAQATTAILAGARAAAGG